MPTPKLWSKLENAGDVTSPELGTGGAEVGSPTYEAAKFNNGILSNSNNEGCTFPTAANSINNDKGTIEFWAKLKFAPEDGDLHMFFECIYSTNGGMALYFNPATDGFKIIIYTEGDKVIDIDTGAVAWNVNDLLHFGFTWDRQGNDIGGGKTVLLKIDDVEKVSSTDTWNTDIVRANLFIGVQNDGSYHSDAVIDNLKTFDICKIDFSDKDTEGEEEAEAVKTLIQATLISAVPLIAIPTLGQILRLIES